MKKHQSAVDIIKQKAENDLYTFAKLVNPSRVYGSVHKELFDWWTREEVKDNTLVLLPRDHQKSHCAAVKAAWLLTRDPSKTILYVSATADLAEKQLYAIKNILTSEVYRRYWPNMVNVEEAKREMWNTSEIAVDHEARRREGVRDPSIKAAGITTNITGFHATDVFLDDLVVPNNAYTEDGRDKVSSLYSQLASIETTGATETVVGTRYHPADLYHTLKEMTEDVYDEEGELVAKEYVYETFERVVEEQGVFLWPKEARSDGKMFGFDHKELSRKKAKYVDRTQFYAQYYNNPNDIETQKIGRDKFQYYDKKFVVQKEGQWHFKDRKLNVFAAIDFAFSMNKKADFTALVVIGVDRENNIYVLDIDRFKTDGKISVYFKHIMDMYVKWGFKKIRAEITTAQQSIVKELKETYVKQYGLALKIDEYRPNRHEGTKEERISATLEPRYDNLQVWHYKGGHCSTLEDELIMAHPPHDDVKDALTAAVDIAIPPKGNFVNYEEVLSQYSTHPRFGGINF